MSPERQRIAMAKLDGFVSHGNLGVWHVGDGLAGYVDYKLTSVPDYLNDANAANRAQALVKDRWTDYVVYLHRVVGDWGFDPREVESDLQSARDDDTRWGTLAMWDIANATPAQKVEAILRTLGRWEDPI